MEHLDYPVMIRKTDLENVECLDRWVILVRLVHQDSLVAVHPETILDHVDLRENLAS